MHAHGGSPPLAVYASTKAALAALTKNAAHAHRFDRIRVNGDQCRLGRHAGRTADAGGHAWQGEGWLAEAAAAQPFGRLLTPDDVARLALFLLADASEPMTGALIDQEQFVVGAFG